MGLWLLPRDVGAAALLGEGEVVVHGVACPYGIPGLDGLEYAQVMAEEQVVIVLCDVDRPPDTLLKLLHGVKQALHQV